MPRKPPYEIAVIGNISVNKSTLAAVKLLLLDPVSKQVRWGAMSFLINQLLTEWVEKQKVDSTDAENLRKGLRV